MTNGYFILSMLLYTIMGGVSIGISIEQFKKQHYCRFGLYLMFAVSAVLLMAETIFCL